MFGSVVDALLPLAHLDRVWGVLQQTRDNIRNRFVSSTAIPHTNLGRFCATVNARARNDYQRGVDWAEIRVEHTTCENYGALEPGRLVA